MMNFNNRKDRRIAVDNEIMRELGYESTDGTLVIKKGKETATSVSIKDISIRSCRINTLVDLSLKEDDEIELHIKKMDGAIAVFPMHIIRTNKQEAISNSNDVVSFFLKSDAHEDLLFNIFEFLKTNKLKAK